MVRSALLFTLLLTVAACGGDATTSSTELPTTEPPTTEPPTTEPPTTEPPTTEPPTTTGPASFGVERVAVDLDGQQPTEFDGIVKVEYTTYDTEALIVHTFGEANRQCEWREFQPYDAGIVAVETDPNRAFLAVVEEVNGSTVVLSIGDYRGDLAAIKEGDCTYLGVLGDGNPAPPWSTGQGPAS